MEIKPIHINVHYYAIFREQAGKSEETVETLSHTPEELYYELKDKHNFTLPSNLVKYAVNNKYVSTDTTLNNNDSLLLIAPVAGG